MGVVGLIGEGWKASGIWDGRSGVCSLAYFLAVCDGELLVVRRNVLTTDQVTALAPDAASFKAGRALAAVRKWELLGSDGEVLWGLASGSGKNPYMTQVALDEFATRCSCPSRKFPCKHALGLMFLAAADAAQLTETERPAWVVEWLEGREERQEKAAAKKSAGPIDAVAAAKRAEKREDRVAAGVEHLDSVLCDLVRNGLGRDEVASVGFWEDLARRLVDAQASGLAGWVRRLGEVPHSGPDWERDLLHELGMLHVLLGCHRRREQLEPEMRSEVEQLVGRTIDKETVLQGKGVRDRWFVAARWQRDQDRLTTSGTWLRGMESGRWALVLRFAAMPARPVEPWPLGSMVETEMVFYPGVVADRALPRNDQAAAKLGGDLPEAGGGFGRFLDGYAGNLAANPWRSRRPFLVEAQPARHGGTPVLVDADGFGLPWTPKGDGEDLLASISTGRPILMCGEWNGRAATIHAADDAGSWFSLQTPIG